MVAYAPRPDEVVVGNQVYNIEWLDMEQWHLAQEDAGNAGVTRAGMSLIRIQCQPGTPESRYQEVLLHELVHAVWDATMLTHIDLSPIDDKEEFIVGLQSPLLLGILKGNPGLIKYLLSEGKTVR
jgi:hypothetical protein